MIKYNREIKMITMELTTNCNLKCPQCPRTMGEFKNPNLPDNELRLVDIQNLISKEDILSLDHINACGNYGEPIIAKEVFEIFQYFRSASETIFLSVNTNGSLRNAKWWGQFADLLGACHHVTFAIDGLEDTNHIYRRESSWKKITDNIKSFIDHGGCAWFDTLLFEHNIHQKEEILAFAKAMGAQRISFKYTTRHVHPSVDWLKTLNAQTPTAKAHGKVSCIAASEQSIYLGSDGLFYPCCFIGGAPYHWNKYARADIEDYTLLELNHLPLDPSSKFCERTCTVTEAGVPRAQAQYAETIYL